MLTGISIRNFVTVESLQLDLHAGMSVLTGETGAGKSILIDALGLVLGDKADNALIRHGKEKAEITAEFDLAQLPGIRDWLETNDLDDAGECLLRRTISSRGRSRAFINGSPVTLATLEALGNQLVDIHGQHAHQSLMHRAHQRELLDAFAGNRKLAAQLADTWRSWKALGHTIENLEKAQREHDSRLDLLRYQVNELQQLDIRQDEWSSLEQEQKRLGNAESLLADSQHLTSLLYEDEGARELLQRAVVLAGRMADKDAELPADAVEMLNSALIELDESTPLLQQYADSIEQDPQRLQEIDMRMSSLLQAARKHRIEPEELATHLQELETQLSAMKKSGEELEQLRLEQAAVKDEWSRLARKLGKARSKAAEALAMQVTRTMQTLSMPNGAFSVRLEQSESGEPREHGLESVEFLITTNAGQPPQPLTRIASGGELSRISLAIQVATIGLSTIPTLIFDEVDVGIGGGVAEIVGSLLRQLGEQRQILCVTHLPQVAAQAHNHLRVEKRDDKDGSLTDVSLLDEEKRVLEIARMLGGIELTRKTLDHAREMVLHATGR
ncbi:MAG: DNA repair protein RecN [Sedimenticolaceae bacterium]|nr:DNA repair protein RecN [Sedimenticolaceae bacterium]